MDKVEVGPRRAQSYQSTPPLGPHILAKRVYELGAFSLVPILENKNSVANDVLPMERRTNVRNNVRNPIALLMIRSSNVLPDVLVSGIPFDP